MNPRRMIYIAVCVLFSLGTGNVIAQAPPPEQPSTLVESVEERYERWVEGYERMPVSENFQSGEADFGLEPADLDPGTMSDIGRWSNYVIASYRDYNWEIYGLVGNAFGNSDYKRLTNHSGIDTRPKARPGTNEFVFESNRTSNYGLWMADMSGNIIRQLTHQTGNEGQATWSPDGKKLAFVADIYGNPDIFVMNADGSNQVRLTTSPSADFNPSWSPDGSKIVWVRALDSENGGLYIMNIDGSSQKLLISPLRYLGHPAWSPDGTMILLDYDFNSDGWSDLGYYNLSENHVYVIRMGSYLVDYLSGDWTREPQKSIYYTKIGYVVYDNTMYIEYSSIGSVRFPDMYGSEVGHLDFYPDIAVQDVLPPVTQVSPMPRYTKIGTRNYRLTGYDPGVSLFDRVYLCSRASDQIDWNCSFDYKYLDTDTIDFLFEIWGGSLGKTYYYSSRGMDQAANMEEGPSSEGDAFTTSYQEDLYGKVIDNRGYPVPFASVTTTPVIDDQMDADKYGRFHRYVPAGYVAPRISKAGFADFNTFTRASLFSVQSHTWALPPLDDVIINGGFDENTASWVLSPSINLRDGLSSGPALELSHPFMEIHGNAVYRTTKDSVAPKMVADSLGTLHAVWVDYSTDDVAKIYYSQKTFGGSWSIPTPIPIQTLLPSSEPNIVIGADGLPHVIWVVVNSQNSAQIVYSTRAVDGTWTAIIDLTGEFALPASGNVKPQVAAGVDSILHVTYNAANGGYYLNGVLGESWSVPVLLTQDRFPQDIQLGADGTLYVVTGTVASGLQYSTRSTSGEWTDLEIVSSMPVMDARLEMDSSGAPHVAWLTGSGKVYYAVRTSTGLWSEPNFLSPDGAVVDFDFEMSGDRAHIIWLDGTSIKYRRQFEGNSWSSILNLEKGSYGSLYPGLSLLVQGDQCHLLWDKTEFTPYRDIYQSDWSLPSKFKMIASQTVTISADQHLPTLSFFFSTYTNYVDTTPCKFQVEINKTPVYSTIGIKNWEQIWLDMSAWAGQTITIDFVNQPEVKPCFTTTLIDEVTLGSFLTPVVKYISPSDPVEEDTPATISITGWNFMETPQVVVGGIAANVQFIDEHTLQVNVPGMDFGMHDIRVINPGGQEAFGGVYKVGKFNYLPAVRR